MDSNHRQLTLIASLGAAAMLVVATAHAVPPVSFAPNIATATGAYTIGLTTGDLNGDGAQDIVVGRYTPFTSSVFVLLGRGDGTFWPSTEVPTGLGPQHVALADLDRDGDLDLVSTNDPAGTISVLLGNGDGTFAPKTDYAAGSRPNGTGVADLDLDGDLDLGISNWNSGTVSIYLGNGDGTFSPKTDVGVGSLAGDLAFGDLDGDAILDLAVACYGPGQIYVLKGLGDGTFAYTTSFDAGYEAYGLALGDLNGDGRVDIVSSALFHASIFLGNGDGTFGTRTDYSTGTTCIDVAVGDFNLDGKPDVVVCNSGAAYTSVLLGDGSGAFLPAQHFASGTTSQQVAVADFNGDDRPDLATADYGDELHCTVSILLNTSGTTITAQSPATCITPEHACVEVPVTIERTDATPIRAYSVDVQLSPELMLCGGGIVEGSYLSSGGTTQLFVTDHGGGAYTVDGAIFGLPCGATASSGTLFTLNLTSGVTTGTGSVVVTSVTVRDCDNGEVAAYPGPPAHVPIDNAVPGAVALAASQRKSGNDADGTTLIDLSWTGTVEPADTVLIYRAGWGFYPEYDDVGGGVPAVPAYPPAAPWELAGAVVGAASQADAPAARDFWYYVAYVKDACGNVGPVSNETNGTLDYHLGDVSDGVTPCQGDNQVNTADVSLLGAHYGITLAPNDPVGCLDVGPTTNRSVAARPTTDNRVNFEDLVMFAINYSQVSLVALSARPAVAAERDEVWVDAPAAVTAGETFAVTLRMRGAGDVQALSATLSWDHAVVAPVKVEPGELIAAQGGVVLSAGAGNVDAALLGAGRAIVGDGVVARVTFRATASGSPQATLASLDARDGTNRSLALLDAKASVPTSTELMAAMPNPFAGTTTLAWSLARSGPVELVIYGVDGRKVATLVHETRAAGRYALSWDGRDAAGQPARPGVYYARLVTVGGRYTRTLVLIK